MKNSDLNLINSSRIKLMWETDRWDVSLSGILMLDDEKICFFKRVHHPSEAEDGKISYDDKEYNLYNIFELSADEIKHELQMHKDFIRYVGSHSDAINNKLDVLGDKSKLIRPLDEHKKFFERYPNEDQKKYVNNKYLGSFYMTNKGIE